MLSKPFTITIIGRSGCGKGTQAKMLRDHLKVEFYVSTGDIFRQMATLDTLAGKKIAEILRSGGLIPDWLAYTTWQKELIEKLLNPEENIIFDGAPRRVKEAESLDEVMAWFGRPLPTPILLDVSHDEAYKRLKLRGRPDDTEENIRERLSWYETEVVPVLDYYKKQGRLLKVDGMPLPDEVFSNIKTALGL
ncbi:MAG: nucleoside monophosphate kinase [Parcubacteria group bacterium]|nr:nucleoside monophosphate kinase [Parcubacteria group bacterium]